MSDPESSPAPARGLDVISTLAEPTRRAVYEYVAAAGGWVGRDQTAAALALERGTAAHHLDRLAASGLLEVSFQRLSGRSGPGAGRPAKLYQRAGRDFDLSLPPRDYELAARLLATAVERSKSQEVDVGRALDEVATEEGHRIAEVVVAGPRSRGGTSRLEAFRAELVDRGYEPRTTQTGDVVLENCPFHRLAEQHRDLVCSMNMTLLSAALQRDAETGLVARLEPAEGVCCVRLHPTR